MDFVKVRSQGDVFAAHQRQETPVLEEYFMHIHDFFELYMLLDGNAEFCVETTVYALHPGDLMLVRPGEAHFARVAADHPYERLYVQFPEKMLTETLNGKLLTPFMDRPLGVYNRYTRQELPESIVRACLGQIFHSEGSSSQMRTLAYVLPVLQSIYDCWERKQRTPQPEATNTLPNQVIAYINQYLYDIKNPEQIAKHFYISESQLNRVFRNYTGSSVWEYVRLKRLFSARELIVSGRLPCQAAAYCGFSEYSTFYRAYKKRFGTSPQAEQANMGKKHR